MIFEFDEKLCLESKEKLRKYNSCGLIWKNYFSPSNAIGNCSNLYHLHQPISYEDFYLKYIDYADNHRGKKIYDRGLSYDELLKLAEKYKFLVEKNSDLKFDLKTYFYDAVCHIIIETKDGHKNEEEFIDYLKKQGYNCYFPDGRIDAKFGIDVIAEKNEKTFFVQVKPLTFFLSQRRDVYEDRVKLCRKYEEALEKYNTVTYYAIHSKQNGGTYWVKNGNGFCFRMTDLFSYEKENIDGTYKEIHSLRNGDINYGLLT